MIIEWLKIKVSPELREQYIQKDEEIWTAMLSKYPGFIGKEVWINPDDLSEVVLIIRWASREDWQAIPSEQLDATEQQFHQHLGDSYKIVEEAAYQVRRFPQ